MIEIERPTIREARRSDRNAICDLLAVLGMGTDNLLAPNSRYWLAESPEGGVVGVIGLEQGCGVALVRSVVVHPAWRGRGLGAWLVLRATQAACQLGYQRLYLFSTGAGAFWQRFGFEEVPVDELTLALPDAPQVRRYAQLGWLPTEIAWRRDL